MSFLLSYILRYVSFIEVDSVFRVTFREPMNLCTSVREEGDDGEAALRNAINVTPKPPLSAFFTPGHVELNFFRSVGRFLVFLLFLFPSSVVKNGRVVFFWEKKNLDRLDVG